MSNNAIIPGFDDERDESLKIRLETIDEVPNCMLIYLSGYIDTYNSSFFQKRVQKIIDSGFIRLIFHCESLNYVSSTGIGSFTSFIKSIKPLGGDVVLLKIAPKVQEVFHLLGFAQFFNIQSDLDEAVAVFSKEKRETPEVVFPQVFECPICSKKLKAVKEGRFRCSSCKTILTIDVNGHVSLG